MKTNSSLTIVKIFFLSLILITGSSAVFAQGRGHDRDDHERGRKFREERHYDRRERGRDRDFRYAPPRYGHDRVYIRHAPWGIHRPYVIAHNRGRLYYYGGRYYEYYPSRGYCVVDQPYGYEFEQVPPGFTRVWVDNAWCYHRGDFYLRPSVHGFISFNRPGVSIGASF